MSRAGSWVDPHSDARLVVQTWLGTRLLMGLVAVWLMFTEHRGLKDLFGNWDVAHFVAIAENGYADRQDIAFFPGWPLLLRISSMTGISTLLVGTLLALLASGFAAAALYRIGGAPTAIAWLLAPTAVFTMVPYTESVFCAAAFWAWERATAKKWGSAAVLAAFAAAVRVSGVFLIVALVVLALTQAGSSKVRGRRLLWLALPVAVVAAYAGYLFFLTGSWTAWYDAQAAGWARGFTCVAVHVSVGLVETHLRRLRSRGVRRPPGVGVGVPGRSGEHGDRRGGDDRLPLPPALGRGRLGGPAGGRLLGVVLVHERQPGGAAVVPAVDDGRTHR